MIVVNKVKEVTLGTKDDVDPMELKDNVARMVKLEKLVIEEQAGSKVRKASKVPGETMENKVIGVMTVQMVLLGKKESKEKDNNAKLIKPRMKSTETK